MGNPTCALAFRTYNTAWQEAIDALSEQVLLEDPTLLNPEP